MDGEVATPATMGGTPQTMTTNNWWDGIGAAVSDTVNAAQRTAQGYVSIQESAALVRSASVPSQNRPPGTFGLNPQASTIPGGTVQGGFSLANMSPLVLVALAVVAALLLKKVMK